MTLLLFFIALAIGASFLCSILEAVLLSVTPSHIAAMEEKAPTKAKKLRKLKDEVDRPLAAILSLNTVAHTVGAAGAGAQAANVFGDASLGWFSAVLTFLILVFSEIIPKTLGATYWKSLTGFMITVLEPLILLMWPLVKLSQGLTLILSGGKKSAAVSREEITALATVGYRQGVVDEREIHIVRNLLRVNQLSVEAIMTPRTVVVAAEATQSIADVRELLLKTPFSRLPVYRGTIDTVDGFVLKSDLLMAALEGKDDQALSTFARPLMHVPETMDVMNVFEQMLSSHTQIALVSDRFGGTAGVVTLEDVLETVIGMEIVDEADTTADLQALARKSWQERAKRLGVEWAEEGAAAGAVEPDPAQKEGQ